MEEPPHTGGGSSSLLVYGGGAAAAGVAVLPTRATADIAAAIDLRVRAIIAVLPFTVPRT